MRFLLLTLVLAPTIGYGSFISFSSDTTKIQADTAHQYIVTPHDEMKSDHQLGFYAVKVTDKIPFTIYAGMDVFRTLHGRAPFHFHPNAYPIGSGTGTPGNRSLIIIDGVAFNSNMAGIYNFNSYEFSQITASRSAAAGFAFGGDSGNGSLFLTSKSGKGINNGELELNTFTTVSIDDQSDLTAGTDDNNRWIFNNSLSYSKDFGKIDTRVSYNFQTHPYSDSDRGHNHNHNIRVNTGADITRGLSARLILDFADLTDVFRFDGSWQPVPGTEVENKNRRSYLQGNLVVQYDFRNGIKILSRHMLGKLDADLSTPTYITENDQDKRSHNVVASFNRKLSPSFTFGSYAGSTFDKFSDYRAQISDHLIFTREQNFDSWALIAGANAGVNDYLFIEYNFRRDDHSAFPSDRDFNSHSISGSFLWSHALNLNPSILSLGKLRTAYVDGNFGMGSLFPYVQQDSNSPLPLLLENESFDVGADLGFLQDKYRISVSWFRTAGTGLVPVTGIPGSVPPTWTDIELNYFGWEYQMSGKLIQRANVQLETILSWWAAKNEIEYMAGNPGSDDNSADFPGGPYPTWTSTLFNQLTYKNFFMSILLDFRKNTSMVYRRSGNLVTPFWDTKRVMLMPDLSFGVMPVELQNTFLKRIVLSLSVRNLFTIYDSDKQLEDGMLIPAQRKSISLGVTATF